MSVSPADKIYVAGHRGLVGSALVRALQAAGYRNLALRPHAELDLLDGAAVRAFFAAERPRHVLFAAAKVGGILANDSYPAEFAYQNLMMQSHVIHEAWRSKVDRLLFLGSSCIYPRDCPQPMREEYLLTGPLEPTNRAYAVAKIAGIETCWSYNRQYATRYLSAMPTNLFGPGDNYDLETSHVLPALIRKMHEAKQRGEPTVGVWGTGTPRREFLYSEDMAEACVFLMTLPDPRYAELVRPDVLPLVNIGAGSDQSIAELAKLVARVVGYKGELVFDRSKPDGTPRKLLDVSKLAALGWKARIGLEEGISLSYADFLAHQPGQRQSA
ncbi:MAG TPA: GDP-L-fucose synthase, partial [Burkholderiales bacterium]|nr:GDP-L-fucose synthase [Burkholderiales bacterium]